MFNLRPGDAFRPLSLTPLAYPLGSLLTRGSPECACLFFFLSQLSFPGSFLLENYTSWPDDFFFVTPIYHFMLTQ